MIDIAEYLRAKSKEDKNFLLRDHLRDAVKRAVSLKEFIKKNIDVINYKKFNEKFFEDLIIACFLHDLGKINWKFQLKVFGRDEKEYYESSGSYKSEELNSISKFFNEFTNIEIKDHEIISILYSLIFLDNDERSKIIRSAILLHHYNDFYLNKEIYMPNILEDYPEIIKYLEFLIKKEKEVTELLENIIDFIKKEVADESVAKIFENLKKKINFDKIKDFQNYLKEEYGTSTQIKMFNIPDKENKNFYDFFVFLGCLRRCDYSASGNVEIENPKKLAEEIYINLNERIKENIKANKLWQEEILRDNDAKNLVLIAPTGSGKTEFALLWAKNRGKKLVYTLPLRAALNDLYERFGGSVNKNKGYFSGLNNNILKILHSTAFLEYLKEEKERQEVNIEEKQTIAQLFSSPITLTTPDQVFLSSLKYYGFDKLLSIYPLSSIVIDEIQAYNPDMAAIVIKTMNIIQHLGGDILVITATFPPYFEEFINEENRFKIIDLKDYQNKFEVKNYKIRRHKIKVIEEDLFNVEDIYQISDAKEEVINLIANKNNYEKNILIIVNNVGKAIELFKLLENKNEIKERIKIKDENEDVYLLLHSRILEKEKTRRIEAIKKALKNDKKGMILVSTQIIEAGVDIDFDILITEISPIDSQIQRWGRIYRNRKGDYNETTPNIYIFSGKNEGDTDEVKIDKGTTAIYDKVVIQKTIKKLKEKEKNVLNYEDERELIISVFNEKINEKTLKEEYIEKINENLEWLKYYATEKKSEAQNIFRKIAGIQVFVPGIQVFDPDLRINPTDKNYEDIIYHALCEILKEKENLILPLKAILEKIKDKINYDEIKNRVDIWTILRILYGYSFNLPLFVYEKIKQNNKKMAVSLNTFKGFYILKNKDLKHLDNLKKYGFDNKIVDNYEIKIGEEWII